ncbi:MAG: hypothetical protein IJ666_07295 [Ruminococcus sp.]|nr:hypothetical protein [Ruminococcus sp.]
MKRLIKYFIAFLVMNTVCLMSAYAADFGDISGDGRINAADASMILVKYAEISVDNTVLSEEDRLIYDINLDRKLDSSDASCVLEYYAYVSTGGNESLGYFLSNPPEAYDPEITTTAPVRTLYTFDGTAISVNAGETKTWRCTVVNAVAIEFETPSESLVLPERIECRLPSCDVEVPISCYSGVDSENTWVQIILIDEDGGRHPYGKTSAFEVYINGNPTTTNTDPAVYPNNSYSKIYKGGEVTLSCVVYDASELDIETDNDDISVPSKIECKYPYDICYITFKCSENADEVYTEIKITPKNPDGAAGKTKSFYMQIYSPPSDDAVG